MVAVRDDVPSVLLPRTGSGLLPDLRFADGIFDRSALRQYDTEGVNQILRE